MGINTNKLKKRILIFLFIPLLALVPCLTNDIYIEIGSSLILSIYVGFIIFLRDSLKPEDYFKKDKLGDTSEDELVDSADKDLQQESSSFETDMGEDFTIVSPNKKVEVITGDEYRPKKVENQHDFFKPPDLKENFDRIANEDFPEDVSHDEQFGFVLEKLLNFVKDAYVAHSVVFFWFNGKKEKLTLDKFVSSSSDIAQQKFELENDILSNIIRNEEPELLTEITPTAENDVIRYYDKPQGIKSFVGVPVFLRNHIAGVIAVDSKEKDYFGLETIYSLGRIVRIISIIINLFEEKFEDSKAETRLKSILNILSSDKKFDSESELQNTFAGSLANLIEWDAFAFVYYDPERKNFRTTKVINNTKLKYIGENLVVDLNKTLVGNAVVSGTPIKIDDISIKEFKRFSQSEDINFEGSFLAIPLVYDNQNYGVLCFESLKKNTYLNSDVRFLKSATKIFSFIVYSFSTQKLLKSLLAVDIETKALNVENFKDRLQSDLIKAKNLEVPGAIALLKIDDFDEQENLFEGDPFPKVLKSISNFLQDEINPTVLVGRVDEKLFAIHFFASNAKDIYIWAEKLRQKIARNPISIVDKQTTFTVSIGVASTTNKIDIDEVMNNANLALNKALEKGGNQVRSLN